MSGVRVNDPQRPSDRRQLSAADVASQMSRKPRRSSGGSASTAGSLASVFFAMITLGLLVWVGVMIFRPSRDQERTPEEARRIRVAQQFSGWDGSHPAVVKRIKAEMNDPSSFEHVETTFKDNGQEIIVQTRFRGKNALGGVVSSLAVASVDIDGNVKHIEVSN